jgi:tetratricopeptide (TPR) repeat protein
MGLPLLAAGEFARVIPLLEQALKTPSEWIGDHILTAALADAATRQYDEPALRKYAPLAEALALRCGHRLNLAIAHRAWAAAHRLAGDYAPAAGRLDAALRLFDDLGTRWQQGRTWYEWGQLSVAQGDPSRARESHQRALELFESLRAAPDAQRARIALQAIDGR